jgi:prepilin-type N-terminal cleavage/methylation domain-containing protein
MRKTAGFTLVELIVVVVVIAILAGFAILRQRGMVSRARVAAAQADTYAIRQAEASFHADSGRYADLETLTRGGYAPQPTAGNELSVTLNPQGYSAVVELGDGQGNGADRGGCRLEVSGTTEALACSADAVPATASGEAPWVTGIAR